ncbi:daf-6 [Cordylochernes scorpioides]|uniref:Daf-6 n=1 Tax=Cordylochernes scorpioides TaxID=51811 RepID=A0ABY6KJR2_9ARAC|nr:daf-6 [Cordylochernes scorpioides]
MIRHNFPPSHQKHYDFGRETKYISGFGRLLIETLDGNSIFRQNIVEEVFRIDRAVRSMVISDLNGKKWDYESLCARYYDACFVNPTINIAKNLDEFHSGDFKIKFPLELSEDKLQFHYYGSALGGVTLDSKGNVINATKAQLLYFVDNVDPEKEALITTWEHSFLKLIDQIPLKYLRIFKFSSSSFRDEFIKIGTDFFPLFIMTIFIITLFCSIACLSTDPLVTKPWLGVFGCISSLMGAIAGNGICLLAGLSFTPLNFGVPFLLIAIGIDDTFIFLAAWRSTDPKESVEKRLALTYERSAVSVTLTSVTNCASFLACTSMPSLATRIFGIYAVTCCILVYIYQLTFMGGIMALTGRLEAAGYHGMFIWVHAKEKSDSPSLFGKVLCLYKKNKEKITEENHLQNAGVIFFQDYYGKLLAKKSVKALILGLFLLHIAISIYGITQIKIILDFRDALPYNSYANDFVNLEIKEFSKYTIRYQFIIEETVDYSREDVQKEFLNLIEEIQKTSYFASEPILNEFWLTYYLDFINQSKESFILRNYNMSSKNDFLNFLHSKFLHLKPSQRFENDVYFNENIRISYLQGLSFR